LAGLHREQSPCTSTIIFIPLSAQAHKVESDWACDSDQTLPRRCPVCDRDSIVGHGRRRKQAHDEHHGWIEIRRGICPLCRRTFTFLPLLSLPYSHYSLLARVQALLRRFIDHRPWEDTVPTLKDPNRVPDASTLRRWAQGLESSQPPESFWRQTAANLLRWLRRGAPAGFQAEPWMLPAIPQVLWPLRL